ncbi:hypothetical protein FKM82_020222 [Ascaphus truei]
MVFLSVTLLSVVLAHWRTYLSLAFHRHTLPGSVNLCVQLLRDLIYHSDFRYLGVCFQGPPCRDYYFPTNTHRYHVTIDHISHEHTHRYPVIVYPISLDTPHPLHGGFLTSLSLYIVHFHCYYS